MSPGPSRGYLAGALEFPKRVQRECPSTSGWSAEPWGAEHRPTVFGVPAVAGLSSLPWGRPWEDLLLPLLAPRSCPADSGLEAHLDRK